MILGATEMVLFAFLLVAVGIGVVLYLVLCYVFAVEEVRGVVGKVRERIK